MCRSQQRPFFCHHLMMEVSAALEWIKEWIHHFPALRAWLTAGAVTVATTLVLYVFKKFVVNKLRALAQRTNAQIDDVIADLLDRTRFWFYLAVSLYFGAHVAALPSQVMGPLRAAVIILMFLQVGIWSNGLLSFWLDRYRERMISQDPAWATTVTAIGFVSRLAVWIVVVLLALQNLGFKVDTLLAGLGVGGIAVALAVQNILGDLFASLSIVLDKPFLIGDFITLDQLSGTVEYVGLKTTRIRSLTGEQLVISNSDLLKSRIRNYKRMQERRVVFLLNVEYDTPQEKLVKIPEIIREVVEAEEQARFERAHFKEFGAYSLVFEVVYWVTNPNYMTYMDIQQRVNLGIMRRFQEESIHFALPLQRFDLRTDSRTDRPLPLAEKE